MLTALPASLTPEFARKLLPFDPLAGAVLTLVLQRYGQNERSLFTFLQSNDRFGLKDYDAARNPYYNLACVFDYLLHNYYSYLSTKYNSDYPHWAAIRRAIDRVEGKFEAGVEEASKLVKTLGLLNIFTSEQAILDKEFLIAYARFSLGIDSAEELLRALEDKKVIRYRAFKQRFVLFEGTDLDFEHALLEAAVKVDTVKNVVSPLKKQFDFPYILAKSVSYQKGTPRFFNFQLSEAPLATPPQGEIDGTINLIFSESLDPEEVRQFSQQEAQAILYAVYRHTKQIKDMLFEIAKTEYVIKDNHEDRVAVEELTQLKEHQQETLNHHVLQCLHEERDDVVWIFHGRILPIRSFSELNATLSSICEHIYTDTPEFRNELVNRHKLSSAISTARRNYLRALTEHWREDNLGFPKEKFPAEKTIYLTLLKEPGIHRHSQEEGTLAEPLATTFKPLWQVCEQFLTQAKLARKNLDELVSILAEKPLKLKQGFIDVWLPTFLFIKREHFALYQDDAYIPEINHEVLELIVKKPQKFQIKTFDVQGVKLDLFQRYRALAQQSAGQPFTNTSFIETVKPFLTFYHALPLYTKKTKTLPEHVRNVRDVIANATDPEKTFFEDFPRALGYGAIELKEFDDEHLQEYIRQLRQSIKELQTCFSGLTDRIEEHLLKLLGCVELTFPEYREVIRTRFASLREHLLLPHLKGAYHRLMSEFGDREAWLGSVTQAVLHKKFSELQDEEEELLKDRLSQTIRELDNLCDISRMIADPDKEQIFKVEVTTLNEGSQEQLVRAPKQAEQAEQALAEELQATLSRSADRTVRISLLLKLLQQELRQENSGKN